MAKYAISKEFFPFSCFTPPISRQFLAMAVPHMKPPRALWRDSALEVTRHNIPVDGGQIEAILLSPKTLAAPSPCLLYFHGGGFVLEAASYHYRNAMRYAKEAGCKVLFVNYRLAPQHPHPVFFEDCYASLCWVCDNAQTLGIDCAHIGVGGDSAGSTLAVGVCMMARDRGHWVRLRLQMLPYPFLDARNSSESCRKYTDTPMWNSTLSDRIAPLTLASRDHPSYIYYSPVEATSMDGLPPAYIETAEFDCLHDDGILYAARLREAGIAVELNETKGTMHGFDIVTKAPTSLAAMERRIAFVRRML